VFQAFAELLKAGDLLIDRAKSTINNIDHRLRIGTRWPGISDDLQHPAYLGKAESEIAAVGDQTEPLEIIAREIPVAAVALEYPQEPDRLVVADGFHGNSGLAGCFSNSHVGSYCIRREVHGPGVLGNRDRLAPRGTFMHGPTPSFKRRLWSTVGQRVQSGGPTKEGPPDDRAEAADARVWSGGIGAS
jgi:hypothetical protein